LRGRPLLNRNTWGDAGITTNRYISAEVPRRAPERCSLGCQDWKDKLPRLGRLTMGPGPSASCPPVTQTSCTQQALFTLARSRFIDTMFCANLGRVRPPGGGFLRFHLLCDGWTRTYQGAPGRLYYRPGNPFADGRAGTAILKCADARGLARPWDHPAHKIADDPAVPGTARKGPDTTRIQARGGLLKSGR